MTNVYDVVALGYRYPTPTSAAELEGAIDDLTDRHELGVARDMERFVRAVSALGLGEWEELHTATLDLSAPVVPYVGHVIWGENYRRGSFMADLQAEMLAAEIELDGELPDHIAPVLRYLGAVDDPLPDLVEVLPRAVAEMHHALRASPDNPYRHLLAATVECAGGRPVTVGGRR